MAGSAFTRRRRGGGGGGTRLRDTRQFQMYRTRAQRRPRASQQAEHFVHAIEPTRQGRIAKCTTRELESGRARPDRSRVARERDRCRVANCCNRSIGGRAIDPATGACARRCRSLATIRRDRVVVTNRCMGRRTRPECRLRRARAAAHRTTTSNATRVARTTQWNSRSRLSRSRASGALVAQLAMRQSLGR